MDVVPIKAIETAVRVDEDVRVLTLVAAVVVVGNRVRFADLE